MGTWIEILSSRLILSISSVVPCNGNVDWNISSHTSIWFHDRRSLQWERGLKYLKYFSWLTKSMSFPAMGTWIEIQPSHLALWFFLVVPCNGNVDWNYLERVKSICMSVVPCNGNVDWNVQGISDHRGEILSFPAMGTWIEMLLTMK